VRRFSSDDKPEPVDDKKLNVPTYWIRPARTLSAAPGMHRFVWDLHYPEPDVLGHEYPISAIYHDTPRYPLGAAVLPGLYSVVLTVNAKQYTQRLTVRMDPRVKALPDGLLQQFELDRKIAAALHQDYEALQQVRGLRAQLKVIATKILTTGSTEGHREKREADAITETAAELEAKAAAIEGEEGGYGARYLSTPEGRSLARLNSGLNTLVSALDTADAAPTTQQKTTFVEIEKALEEQLSAWAQLKSKDIPALNEQLKKAGLPPIDLQKPVSSAADTAQTSSQDRDQNEE